MSSTKPFDIFQFSKYVRRFNAPIPISYSYLPPSQSDATHIENDALKKILPRPVAVIWNSITLTFILQCIDLDLVVPPWSAYDPLLSLSRITPSRRHLTYPPTNGKSAACSTGPKTVLYELIKQTAFNSFPKRETDRSRFLLLFSLHARIVFYSSR